MGHTLFAMVDIFASHVLYILKKTGLDGSQTMKWSAMLESVCKDIEGVFGILKKRFAFLKVFNQMHRHQKHIDNAFVTCCKF